MSIFFETETSNQIPDWYENIVSEIIEEALNYVNCPYECEINVIFTDNDGIQSINSEFRNIDSPTDVLSFPMIEYDVPGDFSHVEDNPILYFNQDSGELMLGDIILNIVRVKEQAVMYGHSEKREIAFLTAHSMLHLSGYDHIEDEERILMEKMQEEILTKKGYTRENEE